MTPAQCRAARIILKLEVRDLADAADVSTSAIVRLERGEDLLVRTANAVRAALEAKGVEFATDGGVTLTEKTKGKRK
jgi:transcriptional regulator with XRE-family HTH domain